MVDGAFNDGFDLPRMPMISHSHIASFLFRYYYTMHVSHGADFYAMCGCHLSIASSACVCFHLNPSAAFSRSTKRQRANLLTRFGAQNCAPASHEQ
jgi:hypothetical protein